MFVIQKQTNVRDWSAFLNQYAYLVVIGLGFLTCQSVNVILIYEELEL